MLQGQGDREIEVNHNLRRHKAHAREMLTSRTGYLAQPKADRAGGQPSDR